MEDTTYNGWKNFETWNVALWLGNDELLYLAMTQFAKRKTPYADLRRCISDSIFFRTLGKARGKMQTPDGVLLYSNRLDTEALDEMIRESVE